MLREDLEDSIDDFFGDILPVEILPAHRRIADGSTDDSDTDIRIHWGTQDIRTREHCLDAIAPESNRHAGYPDGICLLLHAPAIRDDRSCLADHPDDGTVVGERRTIIEVVGVFPSERRDVLAESVAVYRALRGIEPKEADRDAREDEFLDHRVDDHESLPIFTILASVDGHEEEGFALHRRKLIEYA